MKALLFPGQGLPLRRVIEGLQLSDWWRDLAGVELGWDLHERLIRWRGSLSPLSMSVTQPAVFVASISSWRASGSAARGRNFDFVAGHSSGEYAALHVAGCFSFRDSLRLLAARGEAMDEVERSTQGQMLNVFRLSLEQCESIAERAGVWVAADNAPGRVVLSGLRAGIDRAHQLAIELGGDCKLLSIGGPFHTPITKSAAARFASTLRAMPMGVPEVPVISNVTARPFGEPDEIRECLIRNMVRMVRWRETVEYLVAQGVGEFLDAGPGRSVGTLAESAANHCARLSGQERHVSEPCDVK